MLPPINILAPLFIPIFFFWIFKPLFLIIAEAIVVIMAFGASAWAISSLLGGEKLELTISAPISLSCALFPQIGLFIMVGWGMFLIVSAIIDPDSRGTFIAMGIILCGINLVGIHSLFISPQPLEPFMHEWFPSATRWACLAGVAFGPIAKYYD